MNRSPCPFSRVQAKQYGRFELFRIRDKTLHSLAYSGRSTTLLLLKSQSVRRAIVEILHRRDEDTITVRSVSVRIRITYTSRPEFQEVESRLGLAVRSAAYVTLAPLSRPPCVNCRAASLRLRPSPHVPQLFERREEAARGCSHFSTVGALYRPVSSDYGVGPAPA